MLLKGLGIPESLCPRKMKGFDGGTRCACFALAPTAIRTCCFSTSRQTT